MIRWVTLAVALVSFLGCSTGADQRTGTTDVAEWYYPVAKRPERLGGVKYYSDQTPPVRLARGEYELAIIGIPASIGVRELRIDKDTLPPGISVTVYSLPPFQIQTPSRIGAGRRSRGSWFDPCVPLSEISRDTSPDGARVRYQLPLANDQDTRFLLVEFFLARDARTDNTIVFDLEIVDSDGTVSQTPALHIKPFDFALPAEHSVPLLANIGYDDVMTHHQARGLLPWEEHQLWNDYLAILREHRIIPYDPMPAHRFDWSLYRKFVIPFYQGTVVEGNTPAPAVYFPDNPYPPGTPAAQEFDRKVTEALQRADLVDRSIRYVADEPIISDYGQIVAAAEWTRELDPGIRVLVTEPWTPSLSGAVDIWCVDIPFYAPPFLFLPVYGRGSGLYPDFQVRTSTPAYRNAPKSELWLYTCMSAQFLGYPDLFIDSSTSAHRVIPWLLQLWNGKGMVHYNMTYTYNDGNDPWLDQFAFGTNGDGTLLYPGRPDIPGIDRHRGIASLRMKILRDGLEDYEYLQIFRQRGASDQEIDETIRSVAQSALRWERDHREIVRVRDLLGESIEAIR
jgi:hypothetical protein